MRNAAAAPASRLNEVIFITALFALLGRVLATVLIFGVIVLIHEWGHYIVAKLMGIQVNEFAIGMGPKLLSWGKKETKYSLRAFPIGGFCAMEGEDAAGGGEVALQEASTAAADNPRAFFNKKVWQRMLVVVAGATMNLVLGFALLTAYFGICTLPLEDGKIYYPSTTISQLPETSVSYADGLRAGDTVLKIDGKTVFTVMDMQALLQDSEDGTFDIVVQRDGERVLLPAVDFKREALPEGGYRLQYDFYVQGIPQTLWSTLTQSVKTECSIAVMVWRSLGNMLTGRYGLNELSGPVGTMDVIGDVVADAVTQTHWQDGLGNVLMLVVLLTVNVGIFNLLPLPALDGGRLLFLLWEGITRKPVPPKYEGWIHAAGMILLLLLVVIVTFSDISKLFA